MPRYAVVPDRSHIWIDARSSLHPVHVEATGLDGYLEIELDRRGAIDVTGGCHGRLEVPVDKLRSGIAVIDVETGRRLDTRRYPKVVARLDNLATADDDGRYLATGTVTLRDVTRPYFGELTIAREPDASLLVTGERGFDVRDLGVVPPRLLLLKVHPDVRVRIEVHAQQVL